MHKQLLPTWFLQRFEVSAIFALDAWICDNGIPEVVVHNLVAICRAVTVVSPGEVGNFLFQEVRLEKNGFASRMDLNIFCSLVFLSRLAPLHYSLAQTKASYPMEYIRTALARS